MRKLKVLHKTYFKPSFLDCHDLRGCAKHYFKGECSQSRWRTYLSKNCRKTCGFCKVTGGGGGTFPTQGPYTPKPQTPRPNTPRPGLIE